MSEQKPSVDFNKYAGKIVNVAEFSQRQSQGLLSRIGNGLKSVVMFPVNIARIARGYANKDVIVNAAEVYISKEETGRLRGEIKSTVHARPEDTYFEASKMMKLVAETGGGNFLTERFMAAIESAPDHRELLANGRLDRSGYSLDLKVSKAEAKVSAMPLPEGVNSLASIRMH